MLPFAITLESSVFFLFRALLNPIMKDKTIGPPSIKSSPPLESPIVQKLNRLISMDHAHCLLTTDLKIVEDGEADKILYSVDFYLFEVFRVIFLLALVHCALNKWLSIAFSSK